MVVSTGEEARAASASLLPLSFFFIDVTTKGTMYGALSRTHPQHFHVFLFALLSFVWPIQRASISSMVKNGSRHLASFCYLHKYNIYGKCFDFLFSKIEFLTSKIFQFRFLFLP